MAMRKLPLNRSPMRMETELRRKPSLKLRNPGQEVAVRDADLDQETVGDQGQDQESDPRGQDQGNADEGREVGIEGGAEVGLEIEGEAGQEITRARRARGIGTRRRRSRGTTTRRRWGSRTRTRMNGRRLLTWRSPILHDKIFLNSA